jgi:hypothetical protein
MYAVAARQLHRASASVLPSSPSVYNHYAPYHQRSLMARAFLVLNDPVQSLAHTHVGSSPILGGHCTYSIPVFITSMPPITGVA